MCEKTIQNAPGGRSCCKFTTQMRVCRDDVAGGAQMRCPQKFWLKQTSRRHFTALASSSTRQLLARGGLVRAKLYNRVAVTALAGIPRGQPSSKLTSKMAGTPRRWLRALQCRSDAPSMSVPGQRWSDRERLGSSMMTDIGGAAPTTTSHSSFLRPTSHHKQHCSCGQFLR